MVTENEYRKTWEELDPEIRKAIVSSAKSKLWWKGLGERFKGLGPFATTVLAIAAVVQLFGERVYLWFTSGL